MTANEFVANDDLRAAAEAVDRWVESVDRVRKFEDAMALLRETDADQTITEDEETELREPLVDRVILRLREAKAAIKTMKDRPRPGASL